MNLGKSMLEKMMGGSIPDFSEMMKGYTFEDGILKPQVEYVGELEIDNTGKVILRADMDYADSNTERIITTQLRMSINAPQMAFIYFPLKDVLNAVYDVDILFPNDQQTINFPVKSVSSILKDQYIGWGFFVPINPINNIHFINQNATT